MFLFRGHLALQKDFSAHSAKKAFGKGRGGFLYINAWLTGIIRIFFAYILNTRFSDYPFNLAFSFSPTLRSDLRGWEASARAWSSIR
jgi:hypothetical protein